MGINEPQDRMTRLEVIIETVLPTLATKTDIAKLENSIERLRVEMHEEIGSVRVEMHEEIGSLRVEMHKEIGGLCVEMHKEIGSLRGEMHKEIGGLHKEMGGLRGDIGNQTKWFIGFVFTYGTLIVGAVFYIARNVH